MKRIVLVLLALCLLTSSVLAAPMREPEKPETPEKIEYVYPDDWSRDALMFAVENGILAGDENHNLNPRSNITRAEMAAVLVRLLGATQETSLSAFTDVLEGAWYVKELSAAVKAGIFGGVSDTEMMPNAAITREQAVVVLCRAFGIVDTDRTAYQEFTDGSQISDYARDSVSAMRKQKLVGGYDDGSFQPRNSITRAEVAQLLYNLFDCIADTPEEIPASGWVLYRGKDALPETLTLDGTLILGQAAPTAFTVTDWSITGSLVLRTGANTEVDLTGAKAARLVCAPRSGKVTSEISSVCLWGSGTDYTGIASEHAHGPRRLSVPASPRRQPQAQRRQRNGHDGREHRSGHDRRRGGDHHAGRGQADARRHGLEGHAQRQKLHRGWRGPCRHGRGELRRRERDRYLR